ncbi:MAG: lysoplasmalogenase [Deltaproteobacteria bacterium]|nr:lysoplasmalogenase [Deltaproteobacteria bacterium]
MGRIDDDSRACRSPLWRVEGQPRVASGRQAVCLARLHRRGHWVWGAREAKQYFIAGLVSFLLGHVAYVVAFSSLPISVPPALMAAVAMAAIMAMMARWVFPHAPDMRVPIGIYMLVIAAMCVVAVGAGAAGAPWMIPVGAVMFTASDIAVVRDRFVAPGFVNRLWGLPLYYAAQLIIAWSIMAVNG